MPWWFWPLAVLWGLPLAVAAFLVGYAMVRERRTRRAMADVEARAGQRLAIDPLDAQRFNPRVHGRPDRWRT